MMHGNISVLCILETSDRQLFFGHIKKIKIRIKTTDQAFSDLN